LRSGELVEADCGEHRYPSEALYAADAIAPERTWVLSLVYDGNTDTSEVWIFDADRLEDEPICRLGLPEKIPLGFHGTWKADRSSPLEI
jgi:carotenoid cleavage dioxygenase-like enzyme